MSMLRLALNAVKSYLPDWPDWALDMLMFTTGILLVVGGLSQLYEPLVEDDGDTQGKANRVEWGRMSTMQLKDELKGRDLSMTGSRSDMIDLLNAFESSKSDGKNGQKKKALELMPLFSSFRRQYVMVYLVIMLADWMQGTHMYTLYLSYGVNIPALFLTGFLSGAIFAPFLGSFVDKFGRKRSCLVYCVLEIIINVMEHYENFTVLIIGRILGGISTNLLFSAFESWMTTEHRRKGFPEAWLARTYSECSVGNGAMAILAGIVAQFLEDHLGHIGPFQGAVALTTLALVMITRWEENYGEEEGGDQSVITQFIHGWKTTISDSRVWRIGLTQALAEGAMFIFVFNWVPTLLSLDMPGGVPTGCVFSALMMAITLGGLLFPPFSDFVSVYLASKKASSEVSASIIYLLACLTMAVPGLCLAASSYSATYAYRQTLILGSFLVFEFCVGMFMPVAGTLRSKYVPDALQGAILNIFRLPLNVVVVSGTYASDHLEPSVVFQLVSGCFLAAALLQATMIPQRPEVAAGKKKV